MRLFVASLLEPTFLQALRQVQEQLRPLDRSSAVRWVDPAGIHLTLKFLGDVEGDLVEKVVESLDLTLRQARAPILELDRLGVFPSRKRPQVFWVGVRDHGGVLGRLHEEIERACEPLGWAKEKRSFQPHLTVGRARASGGISSALQDFMAQNMQNCPSPTLHARVGLMRSHLSPRGARYEELRVWRLEAKSTT